MIKIIHITTQWLNIKGGPTTYVYELSNIQSKSGLKVYIASINKKSDFSLSKFWLLRIVQILKILILIRPQILHLHNSISFIIPSWLYKIFTNHVKIIFTFHTQPNYKKYLNNFEIKNFDYCGIKGLFLNFIIHRADQITSVSESIIKNINSYTKLSIKSYKVIHSGAKINKKIPDKKYNKKKLVQKIFKLSSIGVFSYDWKVAGHLLLIKSLKMLKNDYNFQLTIIGDGKEIYKKFLQKKIKDYGLCDKVILKGFVNDVSPILLESDLYVHTGLNEGCSLSIIESMSLKTPVLAVNEGGNPELIQNNVNGYLFNNDPYELSKKIVYLMENYLLTKKVIFNAYNDCINKFDWRLISKQYINLYNNNDCKNRF